MRKYAIVFAAFLACSSAFAQMRVDFDDQLAKSAKHAAEEAAEIENGNRENAECTDRGVCLPNPRDFDLAVKNKLQTAHPHAEAIFNLGLIGHDQPGNGQNEKYWYYYMMHESKSTIFQVVEVTYGQYAAERRGWEILPGETVVINKRLSADKMYRKMENLRRDLLRCDVNEFGVRVCTRGGLYDYLYLLANRVALPYVNEIRAVQRDNSKQETTNVSKTEIYIMKINGKWAEFTLVFFTNGKIESFLEYL